MFDEVIIALTQKFNIEGMKAKVEPLNDSRAEWIYFKNKKEILYFKYPEITESGPKFQYFIYEVYRRNDTKTEITVYEDRVFIRTYKGYEVEITEYLEDYSDENSIIIKTTNDEEIGRVAVDDSETKIQEIVKNNIDRFTKKKVYLKLENNTLVIVKVERM